MYQSKINFFRTYFVLVAVLLVIEYFNWTVGRYMVKPLLMLVLLAYCISFPLGLLQRKFIMSALVFSWLGDSFLMFPQYQQFFLAGVGAFALAHICYITAFVRDTRSREMVSQAVPRDIKLVMFGFMVCYVSLFYEYIQRYLGDMRLAVVIYMIIISFSVVTAFLRRSYVSRKSYLYVLCGSIAFVLSDSLFAVNQFILSSRILEILVILFYFVAQFFIVYGMSTIPSDMNC